MARAVPEAAAVLQPVAAQRASHGTAARHGARQNGRAVRNTAYALRQTFSCLGGQRRLRQAVGMAAGRPKPRVGAARGLSRPRPSAPPVGNGAAAQLLLVPQRPASSGRLMRTPQHISVRSKHIAYRTPPPCLARRAVGSLIGAAFAVRLKAQAGRHGGTMPSAPRARGKLGRRAQPVIMGGNRAAIRRPAQHG